MFIPLIKSLNILIDYKNKNFSQKTLELVKKKEKIISTKRNIEDYKKKKTNILFEYKNKKTIYNFSLKTLVKLEKNFIQSLIQKNNIYKIQKKIQKNSSDIIQGLPKLNSILELSYKSFNKEAIFLGLKKIYKNIKIKITPYQLILEKKNKLLNKKTEYFNFNKNKKENKNLELLLWNKYLIYLNKLTINKSLFYSISKVKNIISNSLTHIYNDQKIKITKKSFSIIVNTMFSRIIILNPLNTPFLYYDKININIYLKILKINKNLNILSPVILPQIEGISKSVKKSKSNLSVISFQDSINNITKSSIFGKKDWLISIKSNLLLSQKLNIGTSFKDKTFKYLSLKDFYNTIK